MPAQVTNYKCPTCTGPLHFVGASGKLECDYCGASYDVAQIEALYAEKEGAAVRRGKGGCGKQHRRGERVGYVRPQHRLGRGGRGHEGL